MSASPASATVTANVPAPRTETKSPVKVYFAGKSADEITTMLRAQAKRTYNAVETFGAMIVEAFQLDVAGQLSVTWEEYITSVTGDFKPDAAARKVLVQMMRKVNIDYQAIAAATKSSARTVKADAKSAGQTSDARTAGQKSRTDGKAGTVKPSATVTVPGTPAVRPVKVTDAMVVKYLQGIDLDHVARVLSSALNQTQRNELAARITSPADDTVSDESRDAQSDAVSTPVHPDARKLASV